MNLRRYVLSFIFVLTFGNAFACDCESGGAFLKVAQNAEFVALVKITKYLIFSDIYGKQIPMSMEIEIIDVYKGKETRKTVIVWGDNGFLCRPYLSQFNQGHYYVIAFYKGSDGSQTVFAHKKERPTNYFISNCGDYWLNVDIEKQIATGSVTKDQNQIILTDLKEKLLKIDELINKK